MVPRIHVACNVLTRYAVVSRRHANTARILLSLRSALGLGRGRPQVRLESMFVYIYIYICICVYIYICLCYRYVYVYIYIYIHTYVHIYTHRCISLSLYIYIYICIYACMHIYIDREIHMYRARVTYCRHSAKPSYELNYCAVRWGGAMWFHTISDDSLWCIPERNRLK